MIDGEKLIPRDVAERHARGDPHLRSMIDKGIPLSRNAYLAGAWGTTLPDPWTHEHEAEIPECFRDPTAVKQDPGRKGGKLEP